MEAERLLEKLKFSYIFLYIREFQSYTPQLKPIQKKSLFSRFTGMFKSEPKDIPIICGDKNEAFEKYLNSMINSNYKNRYIKIYLNLLDSCKNEIDINLYSKLNKKIEEKKLKKKIHNETLKDVQRFAGY